MASLEFARRVMGSIAAMFNDNQNYDFVVKVEDKEFKVLKLIVGWQSEVFQRMFMLDMREKFENQLVISNFSAEVVEQMLRFCYTGTIDKTKSEMVMKVYEIAHLYQMTLLMNTCKAYFEQNLNIRQIFSYLVWSYIFGDSTIKDVFINYAVKNIVEIQKSDQYSDFFYASPSIIFDLFNKVAIQNLNSASQYDSYANNYKRYRR